jgi:NAD(P)-dependent dehydrogenase (short-subunit alcohol dehydrogenase family)
MTGNRLEGKVALITGAGSGIGRAIAVLFAREGASVGINFSRNEKGARETLRLVEETGSEGVVLKADISAAEEVKSIAEELQARFGKIDVLVNNSGIGSETTPDRVVDIAVEDWDRVMGVNLKGVMLTCKFVLPGMIERRGGSIINISSIRGLLGNPNLASYSASKGGVVLLSKETALDYARYGIRVNCICPGFVSTEMFKGYIAKQEDPELALKTFKEMSPLDKVGDPEEIAYAALFFAGDASSFVTGTALAVDGGYTASGARSIL